MHFKSIGIILTAIVCVSSVWLAITQQLNLYIHPRYIIFTVVMSVIALLLIIPSRFSLSLKIAPLILVVVAVLTLLVTKPSTLTTATVKQRGINTGIDGGVKTTNAVPLFGNGDFTSFSVKDWASLLKQTNDQEFFKGKTANLIGFVSSESDDVFFVSRFVLTCCAVDARPIGVPVYLPNWKSQFQPDTWVSVKGTFMANPNAQSEQTSVLKISEIRAVEQPKDPYAH